jgi:hypothetical protein
MPNVEDERLDRNTEISEVILLREQGEMSLLNLPLLNGIAA